MGELVKAHSEQLPAPLEGLAGFLGLPTFLEARVQVEWLHLRGSSVWRREEVRGASSQPVLLVPGFFAGEASLRPMRSWLQRLGFVAEIAPVGRNASSGSDGARIVSESAVRMAEEAGEGVVLVGHSRGGQHGTVAAVRAPETVKALVTLGSPLRVLHPNHFLTRIPSSILSGLGGLVASAAQLESEAAYERDLLGPFPGEVNRVSIWSKSDGIVDWRVSMVGEARNISVVGSHVGLAVNAQVYRELASILEQLVSTGPRVSELHRAAAR